MLFVEHTQRAVHNITHLVCVERGHFRDNTHTHTQTAHRPRHQRPSTTNKCTTRVHSPHAHTHAHIHHDCSVATPQQPTRNSRKRNGTTDCTTECNEGRTVERRASEPTNERTRTKSPERQSLGAIQHNTLLRRFQNLGHVHESFSAELFQNRTVIEYYYSQIVKIKR